MNQVTEQAVITTPLLPVLFEGEKDAESLDEEIALANDNLLQLREIENKLLQEFDRLHVKYRPHFPLMIAKLTDMEAEYAELKWKLRSLQRSEDPDEYLEDKQESSDVDSESKESKKLKKKTIKKLFLRISMQCHPDRTKHLPKEIQDSLRQIFLDAKSAYQQNDIEAIFELYASACALRETKVMDDTYLKSKKERLDRLNDMLDRALHRLNEMKQGLFYTIYECDRRGFIGHARANFRIALDYTLEKNQEKIEELKKHIRIIEAKQDERI